MALRVIDDLLHCLPMFIRKGFRSKYDPLMDEGLAFHQEHDAQDNIETSPPEGEYIDLSLVDSLIWQNEWAFEYRLLSGGKDLPKKNRPVVNVHGIYKALDGYITLAAVTQEGWENLTRVMGKPELASDPLRQRSFHP